ncbi:LLM class flavin-dependent oxidoreductase [Nocardia salmonicida]|uniref:LLM class flavin-dependent oxidoreductase n=1 Tax=Nocardia salmonicida TaxID=53431 RepID=UPI00363B9674
MTETASRQLHLTVNLTGSARLPGGWRLQEDPELFVQFDFYNAIAQLAERGHFDAVFLPDPLALSGLPPTDPPQALDNIVLLGALAPVTTHVGLVATVSTTFNDPFSLARRISTLDHVSGGRAAINAVTTYSPQAAANFGGHPHPPHDVRYARAEEFIDVLFALWDSWEDGAIVGDRERAVFADAARIHTIDHSGEHFSVRGPGLVPRSPQGRPVLVQSGSSESGRALAGRVADVVFTFQETLSGAQQFYRDLKTRARRHGRSPDEIVVLPLLYPIVGATEAEARARKNELNSVFAIEREAHQLAGLLGLHPEDLALDRELPYATLEKVNENFNGSRGFVAATLELAYANGYTVRQLLEHNNGFHGQIVGAPEQIADHIESWFTGRAADGFNVNIDVFPGGLELFVEHVVPELVRRGIYRREYSGSTLREHLGLRRPANSFAQVRVAPPSA